MNLIEELEDVIERNGSDFELSKVFKIYINEYLDSLDDIFTQSQGKDFLVKHGKKLDYIISNMYKTVIRRTFGNYLPTRNSIPIALMALGSYGREQLCVHSDIDLMIVFEKNEGYKSDLIIEKFLYLAWDSGLKLGHRVHEVKDLLKSSREDITIKTALLESRFIIGSNFTKHACERELNKIRQDNTKSFILAKIDEAHARRQKYPLSMQPNIKEGVGALRDAQLLFWIANTLYSISGLRDLDQSVFTPTEYKEYRIALELLFRVRSALHLIAKKQQDQLRLELVPQVAEMLGFKDANALASKVLASMWRINNFSKTFIKKIISPILFDKENIVQLRQGRVQKGIYHVNNRLFASYKLAAFDINALLELILSLEDKPWRFDPSFVYLLTHANIQHPFRVKTYAFLKTFLQRKHTYTFLKLFYSAGVLHLIFGAFRKVLHLPQFDGYHHHPVDVHSIECINALENIKDENIQQLFNTLNTEEKLILKVATLFHDTGKGRKQDHSEVGAKLILSHTKHLKMSERAQAISVLLVKHHILMTQVAYKEDLYSEKTIYKFLAKIKTEQNLKLLYILTYADTNGVAEGIYTSFSAKLLAKLYTQSLEALRNVDRISDAAKRLRIEKRVQNLESYKALPKLLQKKILKVESNLFFMKNSVEEIVSTVQRAREIQRYKANIKNSAGLEIEIIKKVPFNLSYLLGKLTFLDVAGMDIFTLFDDILYYKIEFVQKADQALLHELERIIDDSFDMSKDTLLNKPHITKKEILIDCEHSLEYNQLSISTSNQQGLLAYIIHQFDHVGINIATAKIHTTKNRVRDYFLIEKQQGLCHNSENIIALLTEGN